MHLVPDTAALAAAPAGIEKPARAARMSAHPNGPTERKEPRRSLGLLLNQNGNFPGRAARGSVDPRKMACRPLLVLILYRFKAIDARIPHKSDRLRQPAGSEAVR